MKLLYDFLDRLEDHVRGHLSKYPIIYGFIGGVGIVLFWRGVWHLADVIELGAWQSFAMGAAILLLTGLFAASFIGDQIIISGIKHHKKISESTEAEVETEMDILLKLKKEIEEIKKKVQ